MLNLLAPSDKKDMVRSILGEKGNQHSRLPEPFIVDERSLPPGEQLF
jgi:hypothetical protein